MDLNDLLKSVFDLELKIDEITKIDNTNEINGPSGPLGYVENSQLNQVVYHNQPLNINNSQIVHGPDGNKYIVDEKGLWINLNDIESNPSEITDYENKFVVSYHIVDQKDSNLMKVIVGELEEEKLSLDIFLLEGSSVDNVSYEYIYTTFKENSVTEFNANFVCAIKTKGLETPVCKWFSPSKFQSEIFQAEASSFYKFDKLSRINSTCSNLTIIESTGISNSPCSNSDCWIACGSFEQESWNYEASIIDSNKSAFHIEGRRYGLGHKEYRLLDSSQNVVIFQRYNDKSENTIKIDFDNAVDEYFTSNNLTYLHSSIEAEVPAEEVYSNYVANA
jgi:hypothetical protein